MGAAVVAVVLALTVGAALLAATRPDRTPPATPAPRPTVAPSVIDEEGPSVRRLTYATGHEVHWGDRVVDVGSKVSEVAATDDGAVFIRDGGPKPRGCFPPGAMTCATPSGSPTVPTSSGSARSTDP